jgi:ABC-2 type transport system permease protein
LAAARAREAVQLRLALTCGVPGSLLLGGKLLGHSVGGLLAGGARLLALCCGAAHQTLRSQALWMLAGYLAYLLLWTGAAVLVSARAPRARTAMLALVGAWTIVVVLLPRMTPDLAAALAPRPTRIEMEAAVTRELAAWGDSHNPDDPYFARFRASAGAIRRAAGRRPAGQLWRAGDRGGRAADQRTV